MSDRHPKLLLEDIIESAQKITTYTKGLTFEEFNADSMVIDAVIRNFEIIGEAANRLPEEIKDKHPNVNWHEIRGLRNRIVHHYLGINYNIIWSIKEDYLDSLILQVQQILKRY